MKLANNDIDISHGVVRIGWSTTADCGHLYWAFTDGLGDWLGTPSSPSMEVGVGAAFCIDANPEWGGDAHYGRFTELRRDRRITFKWISRSLGGIEAEVAIDLTRSAQGTDVRIEHTGVTDPTARAAVGNFWLETRQALDALISSAQPSAQAALPLRLRP